VFYSIQLTFEKPKLGLGPSFLTPRPIKVGLGVNLLSLKLAKPSIQTQKLNLIGCKLGFANIISN
jgi:hypothetical protein